MSSLLGYLTIVIRKFKLLKIITLRWFTFIIESTKIFNLNDLVPV